MLESTVYFANLLFAALVAGSTFGIWLGYNPAGLDGFTYVTQQQHAIRALNVIMPVMGAVTILLTIAAAVLTGDKARLTLLLTGAASFAVGALVTRFANQPINAVVITWSASSPPLNWEQLRDTWWRWHVVRTSFSVVGLGLLIAAAVKRTT